MTNRDAATLLVELDAMRLARAEDAKLCARLEARVKELEELVRDAHVLTGRYAGGDHGVAAWRRHAVRSCGATFPTVPVGTPRDTRGVEEIAAEQHREVAARLAEGTRDETARRCTRCNCPVDPSEPAAVTFCRVCILAVAAEAVR